MTSLGYTSSQLVGLQHTEDDLMSSFVFLGGYTWKGGLFFGLDEDRRWTPLETFYPLGQDLIL